MQEAAGPANSASAAALHAALLDYFEAPGKHQLVLRQPALLFSSIREILQIAAGRGSADARQAPDAPSVREAAVFFLRAALLYPGADHYAVLGLAARREPVELKERYRLLMRLIHPDFATAGARPWPADAAVRVNRAYEVLSSPVLRREYDEQLAAVAAQRPVLAAAPDARRPAPPDDDDDGLRINRKALWAGAAGLAILGILVVTPRPEPVALVQKPVATPAPSSRSQPPEAVDVTPQLLASQDLRTPPVQATPEPAPPPRLAQAVAAPPAPPAPTPPRPVAAAPVAAAQVAAAPVARPQAPVPVVQAQAMPSRPQPQQPPAALPAPRTWVTVESPAPPAPAPAPAPAPMLEAAPQRVAAVEPPPVPTAPPQPPVAIPAAPRPVAAVPSPTLADAQPLLTQLLQMLETGSGEQLLRLLDGEARQAPSARALSRQYDQLVQGAAPIRLTQVEFRGEPRDGTLFVTGRVRLHRGEPTIGAVGDGLAIRAEFVSRAGKVTLKGLSSASD